MGYENLYKRRVRESRKVNLLFEKFPSNLKANFMAIIAHSDNLNHAQELRNIGADPNLPQQVQSIASTLAEIKIRLH